MKTTKILLGALRVSALIALFAVVPAKAQTVNVNFNGPTSDTYTGLGAASDLGTVWNSATSAGATSATFSPLVNSYGGTSSVTVNLSDPSSFNPYNSASHAAFANPLLSDEIYPNSTMTLTVGGLTPGDKYNLYLYAQNGGYNSDNTVFTFGTSESAVNTALGDAAFTPGVNYVEFASLTANGSGDLIGTIAPGAPGAGAISGLQVQAEAPVEAPEPSSLATMSLVGIAMLLFCKRLKKQSV